MGGKGDDGVVSEGGGIVSSGANESICGGINGGGVGGGGGGTSGRLIGGLYTG